MERARIISLKRLANKQYSFLEPLPEKITQSFGRLCRGFIMILWGASGNGKTNCLMTILEALLHVERALYVSYEEGDSSTMQTTALRHFDVEQYHGRIDFSDHSMTLDELHRHLRKRGSHNVIIIDSVQYMDINYKQYKHLKESFPRKCFIFISHATGKNPTGKTAVDIRYDAGIKVRVQGYLAFITSRYGGNQAFVIWEEGAKEYWGKDYKKMLKKRL